MKIKKVYFAKVTDIVELTKYFRIVCDNPHCEGMPFSIGVRKDFATFDEVYDLVRESGYVVPFIYEVYNNKPFPVLLDISTERGDLNG